ncbi:MAG: M20/M25/M40 family metallo-hydrolase [Actinomycetota bacterium]|nr:M20/M25/M40 family metallo-hydrolase [Actinomycetota bacterium]
MESASAERQGELGAAAVELLSKLIRLNTVNPPGNEGPAQALLRELLTGAGYECELLEAAPGRPNLIASLDSGADGPTLAFISHVDTVPADPDEWSFDPWSGDVVDGFVRGRGGQDMKDQVATEVAAAAHLARSGWRPVRGCLKVIVTADEECGAHLGAKWLCSEHADKARADLVVNEGGGTLFELGGRRFYSLAVGEKGVFRFKLRAHGRAGHGSVPSLGDNALLRLAPVLARLTEQPALEPTPAGLAFLRGVLDREVGESPDELEAALAELRDLSPEVAAYLAEPMLRVTLVPTRISASTRDNVIPSLAEAVIDCRVPPGLAESDVRARIEPVLGELDEQMEIEFLESVSGNESALATGFFDEIREWLAEVEPEATLVPTVMPGFSDSHWFRKAYGGECVVYGFHPQRELDLFQAAPLVHGADERAAVSDVELAASFYESLARRILGG